MKRNSWHFLLIFPVVLVSLMTYQNCNHVVPNSIKVESAKDRRMPFSCEDGGPQPIIPPAFLGMGFKEASLAFDVDWVVGKLSEAGVKSVILPYKDDILPKVVAKGLNPIVVIGLPVRTDGSLPSDPYSDQDLLAWDNDVKMKVSSHLAQSSLPIFDWKFNNEPNITQYWGQSRDAYIELLNRFYRLVKSKNPEARVWAPGVVYHLYNQTPGAGNPDEWVDDIIARADFDIFSIHIYVTDPVEIRTISRSVKAKLAQANKTAALAITEVSIWTPQNDCRFYGQTPEQQKTYLERVYACAAEGGASSVYWFTATDRMAPASGGNSQCPDGWIPNGVFFRAPTLSIKPSYESLKRIGTGP